MIHIGIGQKLKKENLDNFHNNIHTAKQEYVANIEKNTINSEIYNQITANWASKSDSVENGYFQYSFGFVSQLCDCDSVACLISIIFC